MAIDGKLLDDLAQKLAGVLPGGVRDLQQDMEKNFRVVLQGIFSKMELVTREEFDVQTDVLARTRARLESLERQVAEIEVSLRGASPVADQVDREL